jgi:hypothetical protein
MELLLLRGRALETIIPNVTYERISMVEYADPQGQGSKRRHTAGLNNPPEMQ